MKNIFFLFILLAVTIPVHTQKLPDNFRESIENEYSSFDRAALQELKMTFTEYYDYHKKQYISEKEYRRSISSHKGVYDLCSNGDFESGQVESGEWLFRWRGGNPQFWGYNRKNTGSFAGPPANPPHAIQVHHQAVSSSMAEPTAPGQLSVVPAWPPGNNYSLRLGNRHRGHGRESVAKVIAITAANSSLQFSYALIMNNPSNQHGTAKPQFRIFILDNNTGVDYSNLVDLGGGSNIISSSDPLLTPVLNTNGSPLYLYNSPVVYKDWAPVTVDLSSLVGKTVEIRFENRDCQLGGHFGYTYLDNICTEQLCCQTQISPYFKPGSPTPFYGSINGTDYSIATEDVLIGQNSTIPITELKVSITDIQFDYNYGQCAECMHNPALWGSLYTTATSIPGTGGNLELDSQPFAVGNLPGMIAGNETVRELVWSNDQGVMLMANTDFPVSYVLPPRSEIPCCVKKIRICTRIAWKDANCDTCESVNCTDITLRPDRS